MPTTRWEFRIVPCLAGGNDSAKCLKMLVMSFVDVQWPAPLSLLLYFVQQFKFLVIISRYYLSLLFIVIISRYYFSLVFLVIIVMIGFSGRGAEFILWICSAWRDVYDGEQDDGWGRSGRDGTIGRCSSVPNPVSIHGEDDPVEEDIRTYAAWQVDLTLLVNCMNPESILCI